MKKMLFVLLVSALLCTAAEAALVGAEYFNYADGSITGLTGTMGFAWQNSTQTQNNIEGVSSWTQWGSQDAYVTSGILYTGYNGVGTGGYRDYGKNRQDAAFANGVGKVYYSIEVTPMHEDTAHWFGISSMDQTNERIKFGQIKDTDNHWGIQSRIGTSSWNYAYSSIVVVPYEKVRLLCAIDLDNDLLKLWVNPDASDYDNGTDHTADAVRTGFNSTNWTSGLRVASGEEVQWDNLGVTTTYAEAYNIPEPATLLLLGLGSVALYRRK